MCIPGAWVMVTMYNVAYLSLESLNLSPIAGTPEAKPDWEILPEQPFHPMTVARIYF